MALIEMQNLVMNASDVTAIKPDSRTSSKEKSVSVLIATSKVPLFELESVTPNYHNKWIEFAGQPESPLQDYFCYYIVLP